MLTDWEHVIEACPRARWRKNTDIDTCEQPGCSVRFGRFGMPGLSWSNSTRTTSIASSTSTPSTTVDAVSFHNSSPFTRTISTSSIDSGSTKASLHSGSPTKNSLRESVPPSFLTSSLFAPLRLVESPSDINPTASNVIIEEPSPLLPSICTSSASITSSTALPSTPTTLASPRSSFFGSSLDSSHGSSSRRHSASSTFTLPRSPIKLHRRHHCRRCGSCFCSDHSSHTATLTLASEDITLSTIDEMARVVQSDEPPNTSTNLFTSPRLSSSPRPATAPLTPCYIRARVCDSCYTAVQRAKMRASESSSESPSPPQAPFLSLSSGWSTPTIMEDDDEEEYFDSMERVRRESKREQHEALKVLCNDFTANRVVAKAVEASDSVKQHSSPLLDCGQSLQTDFRLAMGGQLATATLWEKVELKRKNEEVARRAMSVDSLTIGDDSEWNVDLQEVLSLSKRSIFDRRCTSRPPSPQPIRDIATARRGSDDGATSTSTPSTSPCSLTGMARMGASRLQRSFDSSQRSNHAKPVYAPRRASRPADK